MFISFSQIHKWREGRTDEGERPRTYDKFYQVSFIHDYCRDHDGSHCFLGHNAIIVFRKLQETFKSRVQTVLFQFAPGCLITIIYQIYERKPTFFE